MKPKTKIQKEVLKLSKRIPKVTQKQIKWAIKNIFPHYYYRTKSRIECMECGHVWQDNSNICPNCKLQLTDLNEGKDSKIRTFRENGYLSVYFIYKDYQILRYVYFHRQKKDKKEIEYFWKIVVEHWINVNNGKHIIMAKVPQSYFWNFNPWNICSDFEIRCHSPHHYINEDQTSLYPDIKIHSNIYRNGFYNDTRGFHPAFFWHLILSSTAAETLLKIGNYELFDKFKHYETEINKFWHAIKICNRHKYDFMKDFTLWIDYLKALHYCKKDTHNPKFICPENLKAAHDIWMNKMNKLEAIRYLKLLEVKEQRELERRLKEEEKEKTYIKKFYKLKSKYFDLCLHKNNYYVVVLKSIDEYKEENEVTGNCVYSMKYWKNENSLILSARTKKKRLATIEVSLPDVKVLQCRGPHNSHPEIYDEVIELIEDNAKIFINSRNKTYGNKTKTQNLNQPTTV